MRLRVLGVLLRPGSHIYQKATQAMSSKGSRHEQRGSEW